MLLQGNSIQVQNARILNDSSYLILLNFSTLTKLRLSCKLVDAVHFFLCGPKFTKVFTFFDTFGVS